LGFPLSPAESAFAVRSDYLKEDIQCRPIHAACQILRKTFFEFFWLGGSAPDSCAWCVIDSLLNFVQVPRKKRLRAPVFPVVVVVMGLGATAAASVYEHRHAEMRDAERFDAAVDRLHDSIRDRLETYISILRAGAGAFTAKGLPTPEDFRGFTTRLELQTRYPGIQGIGYSARVRPQEINALVAAQRRLGNVDFRVWPEEPRAQYHTILYLQPLDARNRAAIGYDMFTEPTRRGAMERARDSGAPAASGPVTLVQEIDDDKQAGFLIYVPVYEGGGVPDTIEERRERLKAFVYSPFRAGDLFNGILGTNPRPRAGFALFDGDQLLYRTHDDAAAGRLRSNRYIDVAGRPWSVNAFSTYVLDDESTAASPLIAAAGTLVTALLALVGWQQSRAKERAEEAEAASEDAANRLRQLANSIPQLAWMATPDGSIYWYNDRWYEYTGTTLDQMKGWGWQKVHDPSFLSAVLERWRASLTAGQPFEMEYPLRGRDGQFRLFLTRAMPVRDAQGNIVHWFGTNTDVQYRRDAELSLQSYAHTLETLNGTVQQLLESERAARAQAERESRLKDEFLATLSHELRTPLNAVVGWAHILSSGGLPADKTRHAIDTILRNARIQSQLIEDLLDMSRIISGRVRLEMRAVELRSVVEAAVSAVRPTADAKGVRLEITHGDESCVVQGDANRLQQAIWNLLTNAIKFTPEGGCVSVSLLRQADEFQIAVSDTGMGIAPAFLPHVFDRFRQADGSFTRGHGGLGLGLSIVRSLVEMHAGQVDASSPGVGQGATFTITLPAAPDTPTVERFDLRRSTHHLGRHPLRNVSVLVVDDERDARELAEEVLVQHGASVTIAASGAEALRIMQATQPPFDIIVSDIGMPEIDGYELLRQVRRLPASVGGRARSIALTAYAGAHDRGLATAAGFDMHLAKPFDPADLVSTCVQLLTRDEVGRSNSE
jgi:PAS domain S-box-containing protein